MSTVGKITIVDNSDLVKRAKDEAIDRALEAIGLQAERNAQLEVTKAVYDTPASPNYQRTGNLRKGIGHRRIDKMSTAVGDTTEYAVYVEYGTQRMKPRPFIRPAVENHVDEYKQIVEHELKNA